ncbi:MAG TPA: restriction endonuclease subunit S, partial [Candidatus Desulfofervidus auxilii]|nr:restriction endonuclease subunit S [Candidatus Desulfofervidus auxilii]
MKTYPEYKDSNLPWLGRIPTEWNLKRAKWYLKSKKEINTDGSCRDVLSLTLRGVVDNDPDKPEGLVPNDYRSYQIFEKNNLVFKLIDLENYKTSRVG